MTQKTKKTILVQGSILALAGIISKIIGFIYRIPMANIMGNTGNGLYSVAFGIYNIALTLSSYSMPLAVSKLMAQRLAKKEYKNAHKLFRYALLFATISGACACLVIFFGAETWAMLYRKEGLERPLRILAPTTFVVALLGTFRGYYQGHKNMVPTAVSQVIEQMVNALVSVIATGICVKMCMAEEAKASYGAMGGTMGTLAGAITALLIFFFLFWKGRKQRKETLLLPDAEDEDGKLVAKSIFLTVLPIIISQSIYQLGYTMDDYLFGNIMYLRNYDEAETTILQGIFNTQYNQMINLPTAIATAMASAMLPSIVASYSVNEITRVKEKISTVLKLNLFIALPSAVGLAVLADPIMQVLFPALGEYHIVGVRLLQTGSLAVVFYALSTLTTSVLQGCNRMRVPVYHSGISLLLHVILVGVLLYTTNLGVYALVIGNVTFPFLVCILNCRSVKKLLEYHFAWKEILLKPGLAALVMGCVTFVTYGGLIYVLGEASRWKTALSLILAVLVSLMVYGILLLVFKAFQPEELERIPLVKKIVRKKEK